MYVENGTRKQQASIIDGRRFLTGVLHPGIPALRGLRVKLHGPAHPSCPGVRSPPLLSCELWARFQFLNALLQPDPALGNHCICWKPTASSDFSPRKQSCSSGLSSLDLADPKGLVSGGPRGAVDPSVLLGLGFFKPDPVSMTGEMQGTMSILHPLPLLTTRITAWQGLEGTSGDHPAQPPAESGSPRAGCTGPCPGGS